ncbi:CBS domain-containing protein [Paenibacillus thiaminolyticus]|uniref:CBS domain-containing protein n=1 Tax=Paenibacillus thiaminolyticus TaxID=49283 RepID=A0AAP9J111_PANTH|nr:CBS domain-containing protein [Paenibacillus thiaminolyticus]MCY9535581.1 CBS domain-containing protein [Paenibacillus thiaminolyticus]MCY9601646.1 CBS domain-containing protein [Paenibacillus thiaminolyticus]MCY9610683.1 CBS domain-containing protein [Paenibacillus thiaminolyticus]MCY9616012.1 CBS domain-containing protein [Paenibacillus thiaminolyticus]MCY9622093.1 CBS domain-containing protein [Paenibacillus thiaminolyticus]
MFASDIMVRRVIKVKETDTVEQAIERFAGYRVSALPVVNERNEISGLISQRDVMQYIRKFDINFWMFQMYMPLPVYIDEEAMRAKWQRLAGRNVMEIAARDVTTVPVDSKIEEVATLFCNKRVQKVIVERNGVLAGMISRGDIIRYLADRSSALAEKGMSGL